MRIQKCYVWYCGISWFLWGAIIILTAIACAGYHVHHPALYRFLPKLSSPLLLISLIPVHPVLSVISLASSIKNKRNGYLTFNIVSMILTPILWLFCLAIHAILVGA
jgi:hypothetical protein